MTSIRTVYKPRLWSLAALAACVSVAGCTSPPSVAPLLRVTEQALAEESQRLVQDAERDGGYVRQSLRMLEDAYARDLEQTQDLDPGWVRESTAVYVAAREELIRHEQSLARERHDRAANLRAAGVAVRRARSIIEDRDSLLQGVLGEELAALLTRPGFNRQETQP